MGFLNLLVVALMPVLEFLLVGLVGAFLATGYSNILTPSARTDINNIVFYVFNPCLIFTSLAKTVTLHDLISWWFMPINIGITFFMGSILGWIAVKFLKPDPHLEGLIVASSSAGNLGNLMLIIIPAICKEEESPFGDPVTCNSRALSYASLSMALGGFYIWTHTYSLMKRTIVYRDKLPKLQNMQDEEGGSRCSSTNSIVDENQPRLTTIPLLSSGDLNGNKGKNCFSKINGTIHQILEELLAPSTIGALIGFFVGVIPKLKSLLIGSTAPLRVIEDSVALLGNGTIPCVTLILGGNLTKGFRKTTVKMSVVLGVILARYVLLPVIGIGVVKAVSALGFLPQDPLFQYVLLIQFALPPAMSIGTMAQLFDVGQEECSVVFLWTYLACAPALTIWSTIFMYILS